MAHASSVLAGISAAWLLASAQVTAAPQDSLSVRSDAEKVHTSVPLKAVGFDLSDVRLLDGPFKHAQEMDRKYLLSLDADRLLYVFRANAGRPQPAGVKPLGGWEEPGGELRGHFVGHFLSACAQMYSATGDVELKKKADAMVAELAQCQKHLGGGYLSAFPESFIDRVIAGKAVWAPWYTLHKIHAGLLDSYTLTGNAQALQVARGMGDWASDRMSRLSDAQIQFMLQNEQGGINESMANLYALTGEKKYLALSLRLNHHRVIDPLGNRIDPLDGLHANTQIPKIIGAARQYELTSDLTLHTVADYFWNVVTKERSYVIGGNSDGEAFSPKAHLSRYFGPSTTETCNTYNMLKLTRHLFEWQPSAAYMDYYERALYNHILASQDPDTGMMCYYVPLRTGSQKVYNTPTNSFWCCTGTGVENHARYGEMIYAHDSGKSLYVNLFIASEVKWKQKANEITLRQETEFPDQDSSRLTVTAAHPVELTLLIRHPIWVKAGFEVQVNGKAQTQPSDPGSYLSLKRKWNTGDVVTVRIPKTLHTEGFADDPNRFAFLDGPIVLSAPAKAGQPLPALVSSLTPEALAGKMQSNGPLAFTAPPSLFRSADAKAVEPVTLTPFYKMAHTHYEVYFDLLNEQSWKETEAAARAEQIRIAELAARTIDSVQPGFDQNERDHNQQGELTNSGEFNQRKWRDARDGGWFSYQLKVEAGAELVLTYWGGDVGGREFDILVDGVKVATQTLNNNVPDKFFTVSYPLSTELLQGKDRITIKLQAHAGRMAGGLFGLQTLRKRAQ